MKKMLRTLAVVVVAAGAAGCGDENVGDNEIKVYTGKGQVTMSYTDLEVGKGEVVGLLGSNGAGKTTTFYMVVGLVHPDSGHIFIGDREVTRMPFHAFLPSARLHELVLVVPSGLILIILSSTILPTGFPSRYHQKPMRG